MKSNTPQPDSPELDKLDKIIRRAIGRATHVGEVREQLGLTSEMMIEEMNKTSNELKTKLDEYYTNKFLGCVPPKYDKNGHQKGIDGNATNFSYMAGFNDAIADTRQAIKQLSKRGEI